MRTRLFVGLFLSIWLAACSASGEPNSLALREIEALEARVAALEAQVGTGEGHSGDAFDVAMAQYVLDTAGLHGMDEALNETQTVDPAYLRTVNHVRVVVAQAPWPEELREQSEAMVEVLDEFAAALDADDGEAAAPLAAEAHSVQHDFSHAIENWLGGEDGHGHEE